MACGTTARVAGLAAVLMLAGCELGPGDAPGDVDRAPARPTGPAVEIAAQPAERLQDAATVISVLNLPDQDARLFSMGGGDPAINGERVHLALFVDPAEGWRVFEIGDFARYHVVEAATGRLDLAVRVESLGEEGEVVARDRRLIVTFDPARPVPPDVVRVIPAE